MLFFHVCMYVACVNCILVLQCMSNVYMLTEPTFIMTVFIIVVKTCGNEEG